VGGHFFFDFLTIVVVIVPKQIMISSQSLTNSVSLPFLLSSVTFITERILWAAVSHTPDKPQVILQYLNDG